MATNPPKGDGHREGEVRDRSQMYDSETDRWTKRDSDTGRFMDQKSDGSRFKGVRRENLHPHNLSKNLKILFGVLLLLAAACVVWYIFR